MFHSFREIRTGKIKVIGGADTAVDAIKALTIYPWAFQLVGVGRYGAHDLGPAPAAEVEAVATYGRCKHVAALQEAAWMELDINGEIHPTTRRDLAKLGIDAAQIAAQFHAG